MTTVVTIGEDRFNQLIKRNEELEIKVLSLRDEIDRLREQLDDIKNAIRILREFDIT